MAQHHDKSFSIFPALLRRCPPHFGVSNPCERFLNNNLFSFLVVLWGASISGDRGAELIPRYNLFLSIFFPISGTVIFSSGVYFSCEKGWSKLQENKISCYFLSIKPSVNVNVYLRVKLPIHILSS